jgi:hypothetical protein
MYSLACAHGYFMKRNYLLCEGDHRLAHVRVRVNAQIREIDPSQVALELRWLSFSSYHALNIHGHLNCVGTENGYRNRIEILFLLDCVGSKPADK